jgi:hypothetical protein
VAINEGTENRNKIVQKYLDRPLLVDSRKFDLRVFGLIAKTEPWTVCWYDDYYLRLSLNEYSLEDENPLTHITNAAQ